MPADAPQLSWNPIEDVAPGPRIPLHGQRAARERAGRRDGRADRLDDGRAQADVRGPHARDDGLPGRQCGGAGGRARRVGLLRVLRRRSDSRSVASQPRRGALGEPGVGEHRLRAGGGARGRVPVREPLRRRARRPREPAVRQCPGHLRWAGADARDPRGADARGARRDRPAAAVLLRRPAGRRRPRRTGGPALRGLPAAARSRRRRDEPGDRAAARVRAARDARGERAGDHRPPRAEPCPDRRDRARGRVAGGRDLLLLAVPGELLHLDVRVRDLRARPGPAGRPQGHAARARRPCRTRRGA